MRSLSKNNLYLKFTWGSRRIIVYDCRGGGACAKEHYQVYVYSPKFCWSEFITGWVTITEPRVARFGEIGRRTGHQSQLPPLRSLSMGCV